MTILEATQFLDDLSKVAPEDTAGFHTLVGKGVLLFGLIDRDFAREFTISRSTVTRWRNGTTAPHPLMRKHVYAFLKTRARSALKRLQDEESARSSSGGSSFGGRGGSKPPLAASGKY